jgi:hypothetical protein
LIDVVNPPTFPGAEALLPQALLMGSAHRVLHERARQIGVPVIYVSHNSIGGTSVIELAADLRARDVPGRPLIDVLEPEPIREVRVVGMPPERRSRSPLRADLGQERGPQGRARAPGSETAPLRLY